MRENMKLSDITNANKPYIKITKNRRRIEIPLKVLNVKLERPTAYYIGFEPIKFRWKGRVVSLDWKFKNARPTLYCTHNKKAYMWDNVKVITSKENGQKFGLVLTQIDIGVQCERRRFKRTNISEPVELSQDGVVLKGEAVNISYGGVGIKLRHSEALTNESPILIKFVNKETIFPIRIVRTMLLDGGNQLLGCAISVKYKYEVAKILSLDDAIKNAAKKKKNAEKAVADHGWDQKEIKRWH